MLSKHALDLISDLFIEHSITANTLRNKDYMWGVYTNYCEMYREDPLPCTGEQLVRYSVYLMMQRNCSVPTVRNHLSVIKRYHKLFLNYDIPSPSEYLPLATVLKGGAKYMGRSVKQKIPCDP